ncbi:MAG: protein translocase subunit SecF [Acetivibrionales bacterium]|jgi:preprotein translocase subunit SecF
MVDLVGNRKYFFMLSILLVLAGIVAFIINGIQLDIQFQGGTIINIQMDNDSFDTAEIESSVSNALNKKVSAQKSTTYNVNDPENMIDMLVLKVSSEETLTGDELNKVYEILRTDFGANEDAEADVQSVAPFIGKELLSKGIQAALIASVLIIIYVWWRFSIMSGLAAAITAVIALFHDVAIMFAVYPIFNIPINESFIAAVLTILGYSLNDTIIVYDRIRENSKLYRKTPLPEIVNMSIIQTLSRTINTLVTTLICIVTVFIFASVNNISSIKEFSLPLLVGLISGAYSSIFIAGPLWMMWKQSQQRKKVNKKPAKA